ncbi:type IV secretion system DNA-binding domain-containing protein [Rhodocyclus tenuis]|uniref:type IV secretion system DNA-binding domain-containing protein n=1 Tax=Rhodocyclus gracilis TaxID=2929842 RepID=UPI0012989BB5|nr:type IV secretion system DNA-binding domain-containing protein [Rhodocyclus gracilis]MRD74138.1 type IV secretion system DNA-binding domain-containing protein [Rhodocyclus gracilis]
MALRNRGVLADWTRGSDISYHRLQMAAKNMGANFIVAGLAGFVFFVAVFFALTSPVERNLILKNRAATAFDVAGMGSTVKLDLTAGGVDVRRLRASEVADVTRGLWEKVGRWKLLASFLPGAFLSFFLFRLLMRRQLRAGEESASDEFLRGQRLVPVNELKEQLLKQPIRIEQDGQPPLYVTPEPSHLQIGGVTIPKQLVGRNILLTGAMGVGKSQAMLHLLDAQRRIGMKTVVYDKTGEFTEFFYRPGQDFLLNPLDQRCAPWSPFAELKNKYDFELLGSMFVPDRANDPNPMWQNSARTLFADLMRIAADGPISGRSLRAVHRTIALASLTELAKLVQKHGLSSAAQLNPENPEGSESIRLSLGDAVKFFPYMPDVSADASFSIRDWVSQPGDSWLFITSAADMHETLRPFISLWCELALFGAMEGRPDHTSLRLGVFLDELASLQRMKALEAALTEGRKFGIYSALGLQSIPHLEERYGKEMAQVLLNGVQTKLVMRAADDQTANRSADMLGKEEVAERDEGTSYGVELNRDGASIQTKRAERRLVTPSQIMVLPDFAGYLKVAGDSPIARVVVPFKKRDVVAPSFVRRDDLVIKPLASPSSDHPSPADSTSSPSDDDKWDSGLSFL